MKKMIGFWTIKKFLLCSLWLPFLIISCKSPNGPLTQKEYFPLRTGNKWYYNNNYIDTTSINSIQEITGEKDIDKKTYFESVTVNLTNGIRDTVYYRFSGSTLFTRRPGDSERIFADFSLDLNETAYWQHDLKVTVKTASHMTFETPWGADYGFRYTFKKGTGMTRSEINGIFYFKSILIKAEIK